MNSRMKIQKARQESWLKIDVEDTNLRVIFPLFYGVEQRGREGHCVS